MTEEGETQLYNWCSSHGILALGWIHTHPDQGCFLSSVDVHTHLGFQIMLPEVSC